MSIDVSRRSGLLVEILRGVHRLDQDAGQLGRVPQLDVAHVSSARHPTEQEHVILTGHVLLSEVGQVGHLRRRPVVVLAVFADLVQHTHDAIVAELRHSRFCFRVAIEDVLGRDHSSVFADELGETDSRRMSHDGSDHLEEDRRRRRTTHFRRNHACVLEAVIHLFPAAGSGMRGQALDRTHISETKVRRMVPDVVHKHRIDLALGPGDPVVGIRHEVEHRKPADQRGVDVVDRIVRAAVDASDDTRLRMKNVAVQLPIQYDLEGRVRDLGRSAVQLVQQQNRRIVASSLEPIDWQEPRHQIGQHGEADHVTFRHLRQSAIDEGQLEVSGQSPSDLAFADAVRSFDQDRLVRRERLEHSDQLAGVDRGMRICHSTSKQMRFVLLFNYLILYQIELSCTFSSTLCLMLTTQQIAEVLQRLRQCRPFEQVQRQPTRRSA